MYLTIKTSSTHVASVGPDAWNRDRRILQMYTPRHPQCDEQHPTRRSDRFEARIGHMDGGTE